MYDFGRLLLIFKVFYFALFIFVFLNVSMWALSFSAPRVFMVPKQFFGIDFVRNNYTRVQDTVKYYENKNEDPFILVLGLSSACEGIRVKQLEKILDTHILSLCGGGRNMEEIDIYAKFLINSSLRPKQVVFAINLFHLMDPLTFDKTLIDQLKELPLRQLLAGWFSLKRADVSHQINMAALNVRTKTQRWFDIHIGENVMWKESIHMGLPQLQEASQWEKRIKEYGKRGYYEQMNYENSQNQVIKLARLIRSFHHRGAEVSIIIMPEHSTLNSRIPDRTLEILTSKLKSALKEMVTPEMIDLRRTVLDCGFKDISHMNERGRQLFTPMLGRELGSNDLLQGSP